MKFRPSLFLFILVFTVQSASAIVVTLIGDNTGGFAGEKWNQADDWSNNDVITAGNEYHVGNSTGKILEVPRPTPGSFNGDSLTIHSTGEIRFRTTTTATIGTLILNGGTLQNFVTGRVTLTGTSLSVTAASIINASNADQRDWTFGYALFGTGGLTLNGVDLNNEFRFNGSGAGYSGDWNVTAGVLLGFGSDSLGSGDFVIGTGAGLGARLDLRYGIDSPNASLILNSDATMAMTNSNNTFGAVTIGGTSLGAGEYSFTYLNDNFGAFFVDGGSGSITVVPEPGPWGLLAAGLGMGVGLRRRRR